MSSLGTSSPVSASTLRYLMRWPVCRLSWLNEIFSLSDVAGYSATGQVTRDNRKKPFQLARGAMYAELRFRDALSQDERRQRVPTPRRRAQGSFLTMGIDSDVHVMFQSSMTDRPASWRM